MHFKKISILIIALALTLIMSPVLAQDANKNDGLARVVLITAKDGKNKELEEAITKYHHYMGGHEGAMRYQWYSIMTGENTGKYIARSGGHNWADFDAEHDWDEEAGARFASTVQPLVESAVITIAQTDDELGIWPESMEGYNYVSVSRWWVKPGHGKAFNDGLKKIDSALKEGGWPNYYAFTSPVSGGNGNEILLVSPKKNFADMADKEPSFWDIMSKAMGEEEASAFFAEWSSTYKPGNNMLLRYRAELSDYGDKK